MFINRIIYEDFSNYKKPSMFIGTPFCDGKCWRELDLSPSLCQNNELFGVEPKSINVNEICEKYINNPITKAVVFGGLEPMHEDSYWSMFFFIETLRADYNCDDDVVIYTGYYPTEIPKRIDWLKAINNIIVKFGRYIPNKESVYDEVLGVELASANQWAERIS